MTATYCWPIRLPALAAALAIAVAGCSSPPTAGDGPTAAPPISTAAPTAATSQPTAALTTPPTVAPSPTLAPTLAPTTLPTTAPSPAPTVAPTTSPPPSSAVGEEVLFLRAGALVALDVATRAERTVATGVRDFAASPDGARIALVREGERAPDLWLVGRDGEGLRQLTADGGARIEATPSWAPDGLSLAYASADASDPYPGTWQEWAAWCRAAEAVVLDIPGGTPRSLGQGCAPAFSPDGRRIAYVTPPTSATPGFESYGPTAVNTVRLVNRQGQNGWSFAQAQGGDAPGSAGIVVYAPSWSPNSQQVAYQRYIGEQVEVDINLSEVGGSLEGKGQPFALGAGWLRPARFSPDGRSVAVMEHNYGDARGFGGYDEWSVEVIALDGSRPVPLPSGEVTMVGQTADRLPRAQEAAWSPDSSALAVQLPTGWRPGLPNDEPFDPSGAVQAGEIWRWAPGGQPAERLARDVDFASPLAWLPAPPRVELSDQGYQLVYPAGWQVAAPTEFEELTAAAADGLRLMSAAPFAPMTPEAMGVQTPAGMFPLFVTALTSASEPIVWPDGSVYREFTGADARGRPIAGATRVVLLPQGGAIVLLYATTPERWPIERAQAQGLLAASGPTR